MRAYIPFQKKHALVTLHRNNMRLTCKIKILIDIFNPICTNIFLLSKSSLRQILRIHTQRREFPKTQQIKAPEETNEGKQNL